MIPEKIKKSLKQNWGEKAETLNCYAEIKLKDPISSWCCYIFAMDESEQTVHCLLYSNAFGPELYILNTEDIHSKYNEHGETPVIDMEFRRTRVVELLRRLRIDTR